MTKLDFGDYLFGRQALYKDKGKYSDFENTLLLI